MKKYLSVLKLLCILFFSVFYTSCNAQQKDAKVEKIIENPTQIADYVVSVFEDSTGNIWFGTLAKGIAKYDGKKLTYFTTDDGLPSNRVVNVIEDEKGILWFATGAGLSKFDGKNFTNFNTKDGLCNNSISNLMIDTKGIFWIGTWNGICKFNGKTFTNFTLPKPEIKTIPNKDTENWITKIMEDSKGNIWFGRDGYGASKYDGKSFVHFTKEDGLFSNNVQEITEDKNGDIWFGTRVAEKDNADPNKRFGKGGVQKYDGLKFSSFPEIKGITENDVYQIYRDNTNNLWISTLKNGLYKFDGQTFRNYKVPKPTMSVLKDSKSKIWLGCAGGLYRINAKDIVNITTNGPWK
jgi:ligand-binding sensor domain-containing protein